MATRTPLVQASGQLQQLQSGDPVSPLAVAVLRVLDASYVMPANTSLTFITSLTLSGNVSLTIPSTSVVLIESTGGDGVYWDSILQVQSNFVDGNVASLVDIPGLVYAVSANTLYEVEYLLRVQSSETSGLVVALTCSAAASTGTHLSIGMGSSTSTVTTQGNILGSALGTMVQVAATDAGIFGKGMVITVAGTGNLSVQVKKLGAGTATVYAGSIMKIRKLR